MKRTAPNIPLHIQIARAEDEGMTLEAWQKKQMIEHERVMKVAIAAIEAGKKKNLSQEAIERFQRKMDSAIA